MVRRFLKVGDEAAFRALHQANAPALYLFALRLVGGDTAAAEDIVQETWLRAVPRLGNFGWRSSLRTWLSAIAINVHREAQRRRATRKRQQTDYGRLSLVRSEPKPASADLERAIARLPDGYREVLVLHDIEGYTHKEIAGFLGVEEGTSKSQLSRARRSIRAWLKGDAQNAR